MLVYFEWHSLYAPDEKRPQYTETKEWVSKFKSYNRDLVFISWLMSEFPKLLPYIRYKETIFCSEFIVEFLRDHRLAKLQHDPVWYSPQNIRDGSGLIRPTDIYWKNNGLIAI